MGYVMSDEVKRKIQVIPSFKKDVYKIKSISTVKNNYGIGEDETIISYRVVPQLFAKLEKGGAVFTDKGVYKRLPSGYLSSDFVTYGIKYEDMVDYIPYLGYSADQQPQLIGTYTDNKNLSFWMTPVAGTESNDFIVSIFNDIIAELVTQDSSLAMRYEATKTHCLEKLESQFESDNLIDGKDESVLMSLVRSNQYTDGQKQDAFFLLFRNMFANRNYARAYSFVEECSDYMSDDTFVSRIDPIIRNKIETIGVPETDGGVEALKLYCVKNHAYIELAFPNIVAHYFGRDSYSSIDEFMLQFENEAFYEDMKATLKNKITEILPIKVADWNENIYSFSDETFVLYAMNKPSFYKEAAHHLVEHYCVLGRFDTAIDSLEKVKAVNDDSEYLKELDEFIQGYMVVYALDQYNKAQEYISTGEFSSAINCLHESVKYDHSKQDYVLCLIKTELEATKYSLAKTDILEILRQDYAFDDEGQQQLREMEIECAEGINQEMAAFYDLIVNNNADSLSNESEPLSKVDQMGLSFYHYAILLQKESLVANINVSKTNAMNAVNGYDLMCFGAGDDVATQTFIQLLKLYDDEAIKLYKNYKWKKAGNTVLKIGAGILGAMADAAVSSAGNMDSKLREMERDSSYSKSWDAISEKRSEVADYRDQMKDMRSQFRNYSDGVQSGDELYDEYVNNLIELACTKVIVSANKLDSSVKNYSFLSKLVYSVIKNPQLLNEIFHGDRSNFALHETKDGFWYLPESLIVDVNNLSVTYVERELPVIEEDYSDSDDDGDSYNDDYDEY